MNLRPRLLLAVGAVLVAATATAPALADDVVADDLARDTPVAADGGVVAYSRFDAATQRYKLVLQTAAGTADAQVADSPTPFDVSLGRDVRGRAVALYTRCQTAKGTGCDIYRYDLRTATERKLTSVSGPSEDEAWPAQYRRWIVFVRRRPNGAPKGAEIRDCDLIYLKDVTSKAPSRRLDRGSCGRTTGIAIRGNRIVQVTVGSPPKATRFAGQVRLLSTAGGAVKVLAATSFGEESNVFDAPSLSTGSIWLTRSGAHVHGNFVRIDLKTRKLTEVQSHVGLEGEFARDATTGTFYYEQTPETFDESCTEGGGAPCQIVRSTTSPFSSTERTLAPTLTIGSPADAGTAIFGDPFALSGRLSRTVVRRGVVVRSVPVAGATVRVLRRITITNAPLHESFEPTALTTTTLADGSWSVPIAAPPAEPWFSAVTEGQPSRTYAGRGTVGTVSARITMTVAGGAFAGTVTPAQPGRTVKIQRLTSRKCQTAANGQRLCNDTWATVADAALNAAGTGFAATVASPPAGIYSAALPFADQQADPSAYAGRTPDVTIGG